MLAVVGLVVVIALIAGALLIRPALDRTADNTPSSALPGGDDRSPTPVPSSVTPSPTPPSPTPTPSRGTSAPCPTGDPGARQPHPQDGRVHGGGLSFPKQPNWDPSSLSVGLTWAYDVDGQDKKIAPEWFSMLAVGAVSTADGFENPEIAVTAVMECSVTSGYYDRFTERRDLEFGQITLAGHPGWRLRSEVRVDRPDLGIEGDVVEVVIVDLDSPESLAMFWGAVPIGDRALIAQLDRVVSQLRVD